VTGDAAIARIMSQRGEMHKGPGAPGHPSARRGKIVAMTTTDARPAYADFTAALVADFRAHGGKVNSGPFLDRDLLLLTTTGARSGETRLAPVVFSRDGDRIVIVASKSGAPTNPAWFANLVANPIVTVEVGAETFRARATVTDGAERDRLFAAHAAINPGFNDYVGQTTRVMPVVVLERQA
jgi:deazaflavin-dependent oxidoreductase (nitroreductase family)